MNGQASSFSDKLVKIKPIFNHKTIIIGIGNAIRGDDAAGVEIVKALNLAEIPGNIKIIDAGVTPENYIKRITDFRPRYLLIIDAVHFESEPGDVRIFEEDEIEVYGFSTHSMSPKLFINAVKESVVGIKCLLLGIQPENLRFGDEMTERVKDSVEELIRILTSFLEPNNRL